MGWCGPLAVSRVTGWDVHQVWLHIRWFREANGRRIKPDQRAFTGKGTTWTDELLDACRRAGWQPQVVFRNRRVYREELDRLTKRGRFVCYQQGHFAAIINGRYYGVMPRAVISLWRLRRKRTGTP